MTPLIEGTILGTATGLGVAFDIARARGTLSAVTLDETTLIPIGAAFAVIVVAWWAGRKFQALLDTIRQMKSTLRSLPCMQQNPSCSRRYDPKQKPKNPDDEESTL